jgi:hypothetical protein
VVNWEDWYEVSDNGLVQSLDRTLITDRWPNGRFFPGKLLSPSANWKGYRYVILPGKKTCFIHLMMLEAFVGPRPLGMMGLHKDDNPSHNLIENLYWGTRTDNALDSVRNGMHNHARRTHCDNCGDELKHNGRQRICPTCVRRRSREYMREKRKRQRESTSAHYSAVLHK